MRKLLEGWRKFINESDPTYYQETFDIYLLLSISKEVGGTREQVKIDMRAIPEVLTVAPVDPPKGIQRDAGTRILTTLKLHCRQPSPAEGTRSIAKVVLSQIEVMKGVKIVKYDIPGQAALEETDITPGTLPQYAKGHSRKKRRLIGKGGQKNTAPYSEKPSMKRAKSAPPMGE
jgi:hypothetical protein|tara:strand:- start:2997 stop:3518 length:522 start_codon:yes stop_codon:yes gene_type:complete